MHEHTCAHVQWSDVPVCGESGWL